MNNTGKLLRAFIEASGYEVEEVKRESLTGEEPDIFLLDKNYTIDYKVTKQGTKTTKGLRGYLHECFNGVNEPKHYCDDCGQQRTLRPGDVEIGGIDE